MSGLTGRLTRTQRCRLPVFGGCYVPVASKPNQHKTPRPKLTFHRHRIPPAASCANRWHPRRGRNRFPYFDPLQHLQVDLMNPKIRQ